MNDHPVDISSKKKLILWTLSLHNYVNSLQGKKNYTYEDMVKSLQANCPYKLNVKGTSSRKSFTK